MKYTVVLASSSTTVIDVEADTPEEARERACNEAYVSLCHQCSDSVEVGDDWEPTQVTDDSHEVVWTAPH